MTCPGDDALLAFVERTSSDAERERIEAHLEQCPSCFEAVAMFVASESEPADGFHARYRIDETLGAGMSGVVYRAFDRVLERAVAVKLIDLPAAASDDEALAEAKILAGLNHPNLVTVHDAGEVDGRIFIAMELVDGGDLRRWLSTPRAVSEVLAVFDGAANGLQALHDAGLVHRDVKPDNILVDREGRARLADCGLAGAAQDVSPGIGSPAYWAPELRRGQTADARSDQFALCVSLYEGLCGERPDIERELAFPRRVPRRIRAAIRKGLAIEPEARHSDVARLRRGLSGSGNMRRWVWPAVVVGVAFAFVATQDNEATACEAAPADSVWNLDARREIREAFAASDVPWSRSAADHVVARLDGRAEALARADVLACEARSAQTTEQRARTQWCLQRQRIELQADVETLRSSDNDVVRAGLTISDGSHAPSDCVDATYLAHAADPPTLDQQERASMLVRRLSAARIRFAAGDASAALEQVEAVAHAAAAVWPRLSLEARALQASILREMSSFQAAFSVARSTYFAAARVGAWPEAATAGLQAAMVAGVDFRDATRGDEWLEHVDVAISRAGEPPRLVMHQLASVRASLAMRHGDPERAIEILETELEWLRDDEQVTRTVVLGNLASAWSHTGDRAASTAAYREARDLSREVRGPLHPRTLNMATRLALEYDAWDRPAEAAQELRPWRDAFVDAHGIDSVDVAHWTINVGGFSQRMGELEEAEVLLEEAAHRYAFLGRPGDEADAWYSLAYVHLDAEAWFEAHVAAQRAVARAEAADGPNSRTLVGPIDVLATVDRKLGDLDSASEAYDRLVTLADAAVPAGDNLRTIVRMNRGLDHVRRARWDDAIADLEDVLPRMATMPPRADAKVRFGLAAAYLESQPEASTRTRAKELAEQAWQTFRELDDEQMAEQVLALLDAPEVNPR